MIKTVAISPKVKPTIRPVLELTISTQHLSSEVSIGCLIMGIEVMVVVCI
jgi:hypothetical protein